MKKERTVNFTFAELVDKLTISQIKEVLLPQVSAKKYCLELKELEHDIDLLIKQKRIKISAKFLRLIILLSQLNLHVWFLKDRMSSERKSYFKLLKFAQELNGIRNHIKNLILEEAKEINESKRRTTFLDYKNKMWFSPFILGLGK
ncbi:MAG: hypothetical protein ABSB18_01145 [Candidatus Omnitrophota bacterium]